MAYSIVESFLHHLFRLPQFSIQYVSRIIMNEVFILEINGIEQQYRKTFEDLYRIKVRKEDIFKEEKKDKTRMTSV